MTLTEKRKKCIAIVANSTWNIYNFRLPLIDECDKAGWDVVVISPVDEFITYRDAYPNLQHFNLTNLTRDGVNPVKDLLLTRELFSLYKKVKPDIVIHFTHKPNIFGGLACYLHGLPSLAVLTGLGYPFIREGIIRTVIKTLYKWTSRCHTAMIFENQDDKLFFLNEGLAKASKVVSVSGCGVNTRHYMPIDKMKPEKDTTFLFLGRLLYDKGIREYVEAAQTIKKKKSGFRFLVAGELDIHNPATVSKIDLLSWVQSGSIEYLGNLHDVRHSIGDADCIVLPSYREAIPRSLTEAMSMAKPVITTDTAGCREAVQHGVNGLLVPVGNSNALAEAMMLFSTFPDAKRSMMGIEGRKKAVNEFDDLLIAGKLMEIIRQSLPEN